MDVQPFLDAGAFSVGSGASFFALVHRIRSAYLAAHTARPTEVGTWI